MQPHQPSRARCAAPILFRSIRIADLAIDPDDRGDVIRLIERAKDFANYSKLGVMTGDCFSTSKTLHTNTLPALRRIIEMMHHEISDYAGNREKIYVWGNVMEAGASISAHNHWQSDFSGCLYLTNNSTPIVFPDLEIQITPYQNAFVMFSGNAMHYVPPVSSRRICLVCNRGYV